MPVGCLWDLVDEAKSLNVAEHFQHEPKAIRAALAKAGGNAGVWLSKFDAFLQVYGHRTEGITDVGLPSWIENQESPLGQIRIFIAKEERHNFDEALATSRHERDAARSQLSGAPKPRLRTGRLPSPSLRLVFATAEDRSLTPQRSAVNSEFRVWSAHRSQHNALKRETRSKSMGPRASVPSSLARSFCSPA